MIPDWEKFHISLEDLVKPMIGNLATVTIDGEEYKIRVKEVGEFSAEVQVVPDSTKE